jgi:Na+/H+ antiporter NhaD/arsenite permease-like protein
MAHRFVSAQHALGRYVVSVLILLTAPLVSAADGGSSSPTVAGIPVDFILFAATLLGVALFHHYVLQVALTGLVTISLYKIMFTGFKFGAGWSDLVRTWRHEWVLLANLLGLLVGFALLARHFEDSGVPEVLPKLLPEGWLGPFMLLVIIFVLSGFLDNIAAALIGATVAASVFKRKVHIGYLAAIVAASNGGGAGSVVGDTTTTMMWLDGVSPLDVVEAYVAAGVALVVFGIPAALLQHKHMAIGRDFQAAHHIDWARVGIVVFILVCAIIHQRHGESEVCRRGRTFSLPWCRHLGRLAGGRALAQAGVEPDSGAFKGSVFLLSLVTCASMMPVESLPPASWPSALALGFISAVFDNIPLTALALKQGGYDWGFLAYAVGFGGSMLWFGSSAGVAVANLFPEAKSVGQWLRHGWFIPVGYVVGFFALLGILGWHPHEKHKDAPAAAVQVQKAAPTDAPAPAPVGAPGYQ